MDVSRAVFDDLTRSLVDRTEIPVRKVLEDAGVSTAQLGMVLLVGGSTPDPGGTGEGTPPDRKRAIPQPQSG